MMRVTIIGAGLAGTLMAIYLAKRGYTVEVYDARADLRLQRLDSGRSINLAMSCRGLTALHTVDLKKSITPWLAPMRGRAIHEEEDPTQPKNSITYQAFGRHSDEYINAVERHALNKLLLDEAESLPQVKFFFQHKVQEIDFTKKLLFFMDNGSNRSVSISYEQLIGADGAGSLVREALHRNQYIQFTRSFLPHGYKELSICDSKSNAFAPEYLHLWPRDTYLLLGNPNPDHSITGSLFLAHEGQYSFSQLKDESQINTFFKNAFPDAFKTMPHLVEEFLERPVGNMSTINCTPWYYQDQCLLLGDAAHGIVPFFGQGMNCAFEDCRIFNELLAHYEDNWEKALPAFFKSRKPNTDAAAEMSLENYQEIQMNIRDPQFNFIKSLQQELMYRYPLYTSKHVLVMFTNTPYAEALAIGNLQKQLVQCITNDAKTLEAINWQKVDTFMKVYDNNLTNLSIS